MKHLSDCESGDFGPCKCEERRKKRRAEKAAEIISHAKDGEPKVPA